MWDQARLAEAACEALKDHKFIVVSNREPYVYQERNGKPVCSCPAGGLTTALKPIVSALRGTWVAHGSGPGPASADQSEFNVRSVRISASLHERYYEGLANEALWPLCHNVYQKPVYRDSDWSAYKTVNHLFADAVLEEAGGKPAIVFVQDYHLGLLPGLLKKRNAGLVVAHFWHIPWPAAELMQTFPWADELLEGMLGNDLIGFHIRQHCTNFMAGVRSILGTDADCFDDCVTFREHTTRLRTAPISIDFRHYADTARSTDVIRNMEAWQVRLGAIRYLGVGIDRCDYTKGIPERLRAAGRLLDLNPALRGQFSFVQVAVPSRSDIPAYAELTRVVETEAATINERYGTSEWKPIVLEQRNLPVAEMIALHRLADFCMVTPLHDGMNLVAKEFVASRIDNDGVLILSRFAGAARELTTALQVNPFSESSLLSAMITALTMPAAERQHRIFEARSVVRTNNIYHWAGTLIKELRAVLASPDHIRRSELFTEAVASVA